MTNLGHYTNDCKPYHNFHNVEYSGELTCIAINILSRPYVISTDTGNKDMLPACKSCWMYKTMQANLHRLRNAQTAVLSNQPIPLPILPVENM